MIMHSRRRIRVRGVVARTVTMKFLMPDDQIKQLDVVVIGGMNFARVGKYESLDWPPQTVFAEYNQEFLKSQLPLGYGRPLTLNGFVVKSHLIHSPADEIFVQDLRRQQRYSVSHKFGQWLSREHRKHDATWPQTTRHLEAAIQAYMDATLPFEQLASRFEKVYHTFGPFQQQRLHNFIADAQALRAKFERSLDEKLPPLYLFTAVQRVENFLFGDARDLAMKYVDNDYERRNVPGYLKAQFDQVQVTKQLFQQKGLPFYDPKWLATKRERNQPVWEPTQLKQYHL